MVQPAVAAALVQKGKKSESKMRDGRDAEIFEPELEIFEALAGLGALSVFDLKF
jgi:hypothetical protein